MKNFPTPKIHIHAFLGPSGYYGRYIHNYSMIAASLINVLKRKTIKGEVIWTDKCEDVFRILKKQLTDKPVLYAPDFEKECLVQTDASNTGMGVVLSKEDKKTGENPIFYLSKKFSNVEK